ncbi:hypothetical protein CEXT_323521 [Caerostris extrusa]|uniref:Uncharacterized protein n=1 Tax=Caerostris extrusa TaxID=172846 RepID=A0AAV4SC31_CAEEX|nr:hypothetical protein CEXT_323521 [Caerostris extrusa]
MDTSGHFEITEALPVNYKKHIHKCCSIGIELSNAHLDHVVHQEITDEPVLEQYKFVPYVISYTLSGQLNSHLSCYLFACNELMRNIGKKLDLDVDQFLLPNETKTDFERTFPENNSILTAPKATYDDLSSNGNSKPNILSPYKANIGKDLLNNI